MSAAPDISPRFKPNAKDTRIITAILPLAKTGLAIDTFSRTCRGLTNYGYWFTLGTLWVDYSGWSDLELWKKLFSSTRPGRAESLMKPSELRWFNQLPSRFTVYRAHRKDEKDWISYTLSAERAGTFALQRDVSEISEYQVRKCDCLALFLRRDEYEILILNKRKAKFVRKIAVLEVKP